MDSFDPLCGSSLQTARRLLNGASTGEVWTFPAVIKYTIPLRQYQSTTDASDGSAAHEGQADEEVR
jgi:hypothetical protein